MTTEVTCPWCHGVHGAEITTTVNTLASPDMKEKVRDGSLFVTTCPYCGRTHLLDAPFLYHDPQMKLMLWKPSSGEAEGKGLGKLDEDSASVLRGYCLRKTGSYGELIEKINIFEAGLDDHAVELSKWVCRREMEKDVRNLRFMRLEGADNEMLFSFALEGKMMTAKAGFNVYEDCRAILARNPSAASEEGFQAVDETWVGKYFR